MKEGQYDEVKKRFASRWGIIAVGALIGVLATLLQKFGNPPNMESASHVLNAISPAP